MGRSSPDDAIKVAIIDQQRVFVDALVYRLENESGIRVVGTSGGSEKADDDAIAGRPNLVVIDADLPRGRAFDLVPEIRRRIAGTRFLFLTQNATDLAINQALLLKADGILSRDEPLVNLVRAIRQIAEGEATFSKAIAARLQFNPAGRNYILRVDRGMMDLSDLQIEILRHLACGVRVKDVAEKLLLTPKAVDNQKFRIMTKIGVKDRVTLALFAVREGLIRP